MPPTKMPTWTVTVASNKEQLIILVAAVLLLVKRSLIKIWVIQKFVYYLKMERSMVQELNGLTNSQFINNRSTFISTAFNEGDFELRKSRIQNLPGYRKEDMSARVNFVVVFQTIEIERLSNEVEALRVALKDAERQNFNVKNYEVQIRELTEKCFAYEREREQYRDEIDKLNMICEKLYEQLESMKARFADIDPTIKQKFRLEKERTQKLEEELQKWRARYSALETSKNREMEDMRLMMESQRKSMIDRQIKQLSLRFNSERQNLEKQIRKLRQALDSKDNEIQRVNGKVSQLQILNQELRRYERTIDEYENKFAMISQETVRLNDLLRHKQEDIDRLNGDIGNYKRRIGELERKVRELEEGGGEKARALEEQLRDWKGRYSKIEDLNKEYKQQLNKIPEFKQVIQQINNESQRLKDAVRQKMGEVDDWKGRYQRIEAQHKQNKAQQEQKLPILENKLNQLGGQNDRLNNALKSRAVEIQNWRNKCADAERQISRLNNIEQDKKNLENQMNNQIRQINELQSNIKQLQPQARRLGEVERELSNSKLENQECRRQIDRLNNAVRSSTQKADNLERKCNNLEKQLRNFTQIQEQLRIYKQKEVSLTKEIDRINGIISEKIKEIQALKETFQRLEKGIMQYQGIEKKLIDSVNQTQKLIHDLDESRKQAAFLQDKIVTGESENRKLKNDVYVLSQEKEQIVRLVNTRTQQLEQIKLEIGQLQTQIGQLRQKEARLREIQEKFRVSESNLNDLSKKFKTEQTRSRQLNQSLEQVTGQLTKIKKEGMMSPQFKQEFAQLKIQSEQRQREIRSLQQRIATIEGLLRKLREAAIKQDQISKKNNQKFGLIAKQFDASAQSMKRMFDMQNEIMKLNEDILQLEGKMRMLSVENSNLKQTYANQTGTFESDREIPSSKETVTRRSQSLGNQFDAINPVNKIQSSSYSNLTTTNVRGAALSPSSTFQTNSNMSMNTGAVGNPKGQNIGFSFPTSQGTISSVSSSSRADSTPNYDSFKKPQQESTEQYQADAPRFQFRTNQKF